VNGDRTKTFLVESYVPQLDPAMTATIAGRLDRAAAGLRGLGLSVFWLRSLALLEEETCFCLFSADAAEHVVAANVRAELDFDHITEVVAIEPPT
jgi:hypothetical protein